MKVKKHPCLKGLLQAITYQRKNKSRSLRHSKSKALPRCKVQHWALIHRSISLSRAFYHTISHPSSRASSPKALCEGADSYSLSHAAFSFSGSRRVSLSLPAVTTAPKERSTAVLTSEQELHCRKPIEPIIHLSLPQTQSTLGNKPVLHTPELSKPLSRVS